MEKASLWTLLAIALVSASSCLEIPSLREQKKAAKSLPAFECASLGAVHRRKGLRFDLVLRSDNDDNSLPKYWRQWWYQKFQFPKGPLTLTLKGRGHWNYYLPVFSYDNTTWHQFKESQVTQPKPHQLQIKAKFKHSKVWLARYVPYSYSRLMAFLAKMAGEHSELKILGVSPLGRPTPVISWTPPSGRCPEGQVVLHARTHPGEVGSSFMLEGLMSALAEESPLPRKIREKICFTIVPMVNVDGVIAGNNRTNLDSVNLEGKWFMAKDNPDQLLEETPVEVKLLHQGFQAAQKKGPVTVALNLHASNGRPEDQVFFFPHFGPKERGYSHEEFDLYKRQKKLIGLYEVVAGKGSYSPMVIDGGRDFIEKDMPESYWWRTQKNKVNALSIEATYGYLPRSQQWKSPEHIKREGRQLLYALGLYHRAISYGDLRHSLNQATTLWPYRLPDFIGIPQGDSAKALQLSLSP